MGLISKMKAARLNARASSLRSEGRLEEAEKAYRQAVDVHPASADSWHKLGLLYKYQSRWQESLECQKRATELDPADESWWWDLGISATGAEQWETAREAWKKCGVKLPDGQGPIEADMGRAAVRIPSTTDVREVIWVRRIDPARAVLEGVPLPTSKRRWRDLVIHDGVPSGTRRLAGKEYPVFDEIEVVKPSEYKTFRLVAQVSPQAAIRGLTDQAEKAGLAAADWQSNIRFLCDICLQGVPHQVHSYEVNGGERIFGFAANTEDEVREVLAAWTAEFPECEVAALDQLPLD